MGAMVRIILCTFLLLACPVGSGELLAQSIPDVPAPVCAYCGTSVPNGVHTRNCPYYVDPSQSGSAQATKPKAKAKSHSAEINAMVTGAIFQSLLTSMFASPNPAVSNSSAQQALAAQQQAAIRAAQQAEAWAAAKDAAFRAEHAKVKSAYKQLDGGQGLGFKGGTGGSLGFKSADSDLEGMAVAARSPFDTAGDVGLPVTPAPAAPTPFFGDAMPLEDVRLLANPENDPRVVDLREARTFVVESLKKEEAGVPAGPTEKAGGNQPAVKKGPECAKLAKKLAGFRTQRSKFRQTVELANGQLVAWENANRNALVNAAKDGLEYFTGQLLDGMANRGKAAERLERIYRANAGKMAQEGLDVAEIKAKIDRLRLLSSAGKVAELTTNIQDWQGFVKDGMSALMMQLNDSNQDIQALFDDPRLQKYFETESPELKTLLDVSKLAAAHKVFGKWVAKKVPIIAGVELAINQTYNGLDWLLSFKRMTEANRINGKVLAAARSIEQNIDDTARALQDCP
ncbi:MAG: hypothetical protein OEV73_05895 [Desulfobulbaceae bacterium]|nr:hypothetical protein [Desulfobulbaceae bacterium]